MISNQMQKLIASLDLSANKFELSENEYRVYVLGKGMVFKSFLLCYDKIQNKTVELIKYGLFNRKKV